MFLFSDYINQTINKYFIFHKITISVISTGGNGSIVNIPVVLFLSIVLRSLKIWLSQVANSTLKFPNISRSQRAKKQAVALFSRYLKGQNDSNKEFETFVAFII